MFTSFDKEPVVPVGMQRCCRCRKVEPISFFPVKENKEPRRICLYCFSHIHRKHQPAPEELKYYVSSRARAREKTEANREFWRRRFGYDAIEPASEQADHNTEEFNISARAAAVLKEQAIYERIKDQKPTTTQDVLDMLKKTHKEEKSDS